VDENVGGEGEGGVSYSKSPPYHRRKHKEEGGGRTEPPQRRLPTVGKRGEFGGEKKKKRGGEYGHLESFPGYEETGGGGREEKVRHLLCLRCGSAREGKDEGGKGEGKKSRLSSCAVAAGRGGQRPPSQWRHRLRATNKEKGGIKKKEGKRCGGTFFIWRGRKGRGKDSTAPRIARDMEKRSEGEKKKERKGRCRHVTFIRLAAEQGKGGEKKKGERDPRCHWPHADSP